MGFLKIQSILNHSDNIKPLITLIAQMAQMEEFIIIELGNLDHNKTSVLSVLSVVKLI